MHYAEWSMCFQAIKGYKPTGILHELLLLIEIDNAETARVSAGTVVTVMMMFNGTLFLGEAS